MGGSVFVDRLDIQHQRRKMRLTTQLKPLYGQNERDKMLTLKGKLLGQTYPRKVEEKNNDGLHQPYLNPR